MGRRSPPRLRVHDVPIPGNHDERDVLASPEASPVPARVQRRFPRGVVRETPRRERGARLGADGDDAATKRERGDDVIGHEEPFPPVPLDAGRSRGRASNLRRLGARHLPQPLVEIGQRLLLGERRAAFPKTNDAGAAAPPSRATVVDASDARRSENAHPSGNTTRSTPPDVLWLFVTRYGRFAASAQSVARSPRATSTRRSRNAPPGAKVFFARFTALRRFSVPSSDFRPETPSRR